MNLKRLLKLTVAVIVFVLGAYCGVACAATSGLYDDAMNYQKPDTELYRRITLDAYPDGVPDFPVDLSWHRVKPPIDDGKIDAEYKKGMYFYINDISDMSTDSRITQALNSILRRTKIRLTE